MLYEINGKYYILVEKKYISVNFDIKDNNVILVSNRKDYIEKTNKVKVKAQPFNDEFKKSIKEKHTKKNISEEQQSSENNGDKPSRNRYNR